MQKVDTAELRRLHEAATKGMNWQEEVAFSEACKVHIPALLDDLEAARAENERLTDVIFQGEGIDAAGELGITRANFREWLRERDKELQAARQESATMRATIISAMVDVQHNLPGNGHAKLSLLLDGVMKTPRNNEERLLEEVRELKSERDAAVLILKMDGHATEYALGLLDARDRRMKAIGAAEELERLAKENEPWPIQCFELKQRAAKLRQEAEGK